MIRTAKVAVCSEIRTKHSTQIEQHVEFLNVKPGAESIYISFSDIHITYYPVTG